jgi:hypothetical protein
MSGPIRQPLADVTTVTPTLNDKAVTIQANTVRTSSYTAIYNLFKTGFDAVYASIAALNDKLSLTGGTMRGPIAMGTSKITGLADPTANQDAATKKYVDTTAGGGNKQDNYDLSNVGVSATTVTINALSGVATFTQKLRSKSNAYYEINNTEIDEGDKIEYHLYYTGAGFPIIMHYQTIANRIKLHIGNPAVDGGSGTDTDADLVVTFRKI